MRLLFLFPSFSMLYEALPIVIFSIAVALGFSLGARRPQPQEVERE